MVVLDNSVRGCLSIPKDHLIYDTVIPGFFKTQDFNDDDNNNEDDDHEHDDKDDGELKI